MIPVYRIVLSDRDFDNFASQPHTNLLSRQINGQSEDMTAKEKLLLWSQRMTDGYQGIRCDNFTTSWRDGKLFNAVIHKH